MSHTHDQRLLAKFWAHPVPNSIAYKDVVTMFRHLGAEIEEHSKSKLGVHLGGKTYFLHHADHGLQRETVVSIRRFLESCGITPDEGASSA